MDGGPGNDPARGICSLAPSNHNGNRVQGMWAAGLRQPPGERGLNSSLHYLRTKILRRTRSGNAQEGIDSTGIKLNSSDAGLCRALRVVLHLGVGVLLSDEYCHEWSIPQHPEPVAFIWIRIYPGFPEALGYCSLCVRQTAGIESQCGCGNPRFR